MIKRLLRQVDSDSSDSEDETRSHVAQKVQAADTMARLIGDLGIVEHNICPGANAHALGKGKGDGETAIETREDDPCCSADFETDFVIDTAGSLEELTVQSQPDPRLRRRSRRHDAKIASAPSAKVSTVSAIDADINMDEEVYFDLSVLETGVVKADPRTRRIDLKLGRQDEMMKKAVITDDFEKKHVIPAYYMSEKEKKRLRKAERAKTKGAQWFDMRAPEVTEEQQRDLEILQMRDVLEPKRNYRSNDLKVLPKFYQVGTIVEDASDFYTARIPKKERKRTMVDELLADAEFRREKKREYKEIMAKQAKKKYPKLKKRRKVATSE